MNCIFRATAAAALAAAVIARAAPQPGRCGTIGNLPESTVIPAGVNVPPEIQVAPSEGVFYLRLFAKGQQDYRCDVGTGWTLVEPKAFLFNSKESSNGSPVGSHFFLGEPDGNGGRAIWAGKDMQTCGRVVTKKVSEVPSPGGANNIAWLKTSTTETQGAGPLSEANFVMRVLTEGGQKPPAEECGGPKFANGQMFNSSYTAEYWFFRRP